MTMKKVAGVTGLIVDVPEDVLFALRERDFGSGSRLGIFV